MDNLSIKVFSRNVSSGNWTITCSREVALTLAGLYFAGCKRVVGNTCKDPILIRIVLLESSTSIHGIKLPSPEKELEFLCDCIGQEFIREAQYLQPYVATISNDNGDIGGLLIPILADEKSIDNFLTL